MLILFIIYVNLLNNKYFSNFVINYINLLMIYVVVVINLSIVLLIEIVTISIHSIFIEDSNKFHYLSRF